jgi:hypothetical protein
VDSSVIFLPLFAVYAEPASGTKTEPPGSRKDLVAPKAFEMVALGTDHLEPHSRHVIIAFELLLISFAKISVELHFGHFISPPPSLG